MVRPQVLTRFRKKTLAARTRAACQLFFTGRETEIRGGAAHIVDIALEIRLLGQKLCLLHQGFVASGLDDAALMEGQGAETACTETSPVADQAELDFPDGGHASKLLIGGMVVPHVRKSIYLIHFLLAQRLGRRILHHKQLIPIRLHQTFPGKRVRIAVLDIEALCILLLVP